MSERGFNIVQLPVDADHQNQLLSLQNEILESILDNQNHYLELLNELCFLAESLVPNATALVMILDDEKGSLQLTAAPSAPQQALKDFSDLSPVLGNGSCANAVLTGQPHYVSNTFNNPYWDNIQALAGHYQIAACWSHPIFTSQKKPLGTFALTSAEHRDPDIFQQNVLKVCANLVGLICQRKKQQDILWETANLDALTGLANRKLLDTQLRHAIKNAKRNHKHIAVFFIDLDNFKKINDSLGHDFGDLVLTSAKKLIQASVREGDLIARIGGDEFVIVLENLSEMTDIDKVAQKLLLSFQQPLELNQQKVTVQFSIGVSIYPEDGTSYNDLMKNADIAMYQAKSNGKNNIQYFKPQLAESIRQRLELEKEIRQAIDKQEFQLVYQPEFIAGSDEIDCLEVLIRWNHPTRGQLLPEEFLPFAEKNQLIREISIYVFRGACLQGAAWLAAGKKPPRLAVNFSTSQLTESCAERLDMLLEKTGLPPEYLEIEITETLLNNRGPDGIGELIKMRSLGVSIAMDDFGTGYSSLSQLKNLPMDKIKIDGSFIDGLENDPTGQNIVKSVLVMGKSLGMRVVAENVENQAQKDFLVAHGCDILQGFHCHKPVPAEQIEKLF